MKLKIIALALLILPFATFATKPAFVDGEQLKYVVSYRAALIPNIKVAEVTFKTTNQKLGDKDVYHIWANGKVMQGFKWFFDLDNTYETWLDKTTLKPLKFNGRLREANYRFNMDYVYSWSNMEVYTSYRNLKNPEAKYKTMKLSENSFDPLALFFNLRTTDIDNLKQGESKTLRLVLEDTIRTIKYTFHGREQRNLGIVGRFKTLKFSCQLVSSNGESFKDGSEFYIWISDDKNKIPLYMESPIRVGSVRATITSYKNLSAELESKIK